MSEKQPTYSEALQELETILREIEEGEPDVDELSAKVKRAAFLLRYCEEKLQKASHEVEEILTSLDEEGGTAKDEAPEEPEI